MTVGIYAIVAPSGKRYVGQSRSSIERRFEYHRGWLMQGKHPCVALQHEWNTYKPHRLSEWQWLILDVPLHPNMIVLDTLEKYYIRNSPAGVFNKQLIKKASSQ